VSNVRQNQIMQIRNNCLRKDVGNALAVAAEAFFFSLYIQLVSPVSMPLNQSKSLL
jgi:hypothetical protein